MLSQVRALGATVTDPKGEVLGTIEEVIVHSESDMDCLRHNVFPLSGYADLALSCPMGSVFSRRKPARVGYTQREIKACPGFERDDRPDFGNLQLGHKIYHFAGSLPFGIRTTGIKPRPTPSKKKLFLQTRGIAKANRSPCFTLTGK